MTFALTQFMRRRQIKSYIEKREEERKTYVLGFVANIHACAIVTMIFTYIGTYECSSDKSLFAWVSNDSCFVTVDQFAVYNILFTFAYHCFDTFMIYITESKMEGADDQLKGQMLCHHGMIIIGVLASFNLGYGLIWVVNLMFLAEASNFFLNYRSMYKKEELN